MVAGELTGDAVWEGRVELGGDVVVPAGVTLRLRPGVELSFAARPGWSCAVFRSAPEGYPIEASSRELCDLVVFGRLEVQGSAARPAVLGAGSRRWGGITVLGQGAAALSHASLACAEERLIEVFDDGKVEARDCSFSDSKVGALAWGLSSLELVGSRFERLECCVLCREGSVARLSSVFCAQAAQGVWTQHWALARLQDCVLSNCSDFGAGAYDRSRIWSEGGSASGCGRGIVAGSEAIVELRGTSLSRNRIGAEGIESARLALRGCAFEGNEMPVRSESQARVSQLA